VRSATATKPSSSIFAGLRAYGRAPATFGLLEPNLSGFENRYASDYREFESPPSVFAGFRMVAGDLVNSEPELAVPARPQEDAQNRVSATRTCARLARKRRSWSRGLPHGRAGRLSPCCMSAPFKYHLQQVADELVGRGSNGGRSLTLPPGCEDIEVWAEPPRSGPVGRRGYSEGSS
jgi:hypothetical protein